jgi:outer membrane protein assembly factor BamB
MSSKRRIGLVLAGVGALSALSFLPAALGQVKVEIKAAAAPLAARRPVPPIIGQLDNEMVPPGDFEGIQLPKNPDAQKLIAAAEDLIKESLQKPDNPQWVEAARALQSLLDAPEDAFVQLKRKGPDGKETVHWTSIRSEANRLLGAMPPEGLEFYEIRYGPSANALLSEAKARGDVQLLQQVARRYLYTKAGEKATGILGTYYLDRRQYLPAALCYERLIQRQKTSELESRTLFNAALAFSRVGDRRNLDRVWAALSTKVGRQGLTIQEQLVQLDVLRREVDKAAASAETASLHDWHMYRGNSTRAVQGHGGPPFLEPRWTVSTLPTEPEVKNWIESTLFQPAVSHLEQRNQAILPGFFPIAANGLLVYRAHDGVYAVELRTGKLKWRQPHDGSLYDMGKTLTNRQYLSQQTQWLSTYLSFGPQSVFFENSVIGSLSTDGTRVYCIDDLAVPPPPQALQQLGFPHQQINLGPFQKVFSHSQLHCYSLENGKLQWILGDPNDEKNKEYRDTFFLSPPLPLAGKLYVLAEKAGELRLLCLEPLKGEVVWSQMLATTREKLPFDVSRRINAAHLAYGDGILVCPTNAGAVLGLDLLTRSLVWAHNYRETDSNAVADAPLPGAPFPGGKPIAFDRFGRPIRQGPGFHTDWKIAAPAIQDGKVIISSPDGSALHCLDLRTGRPIWKEKQQNDDLYMAGVFNGKVLVVGKNNCRALALADGKPLWVSPSTGLPSGQGVASDNIYYLPLKSTADTKEPAIYGIDLERGVIRSRTVSRKKEAPGNLIFHDGDVLSQTLTAVTAFPQAKVKLDLITARLKDNPNDPVGLTERGELRLDKGDLDGALEDLTAALANNPPPDVRPKARTKLYETLRDLFQDNFNKAEQRGLLERYQEMCKIEVPADADEPTKTRLAEEQRRRQADFLCLLAKGREQQGRLVDAFQAYMDFGAVAGNQELVTVIDELSTKSRPDVWARGRIAAMIAKANDAQRQPLRDKIAARWKEVEGTSNLDDLRRFVALFGSLFEAGQQARLKLAERLMEQGGEEDLRDAQLHLFQLRSVRDNPTIAARSVETLARLMMKKNQMEHAVHYYKELGRDFATVEVKDGKTGADLYNELITDKRFLPYLDEPQQAWKGKFRGDVKTGPNPQQPAYAFVPDGELLPFFRKHRLVLDQSSTQLRVIDQTTGREYWRTDTLWRNPNIHPNQYLYNNPGLARFSYQVKGHLVVFNLGYMVYGFDVVDKKKLWELNLYSLRNLPVPNGTRLHLDQRDSSWQLIYPDNAIQRIGQTGPVEGSYVCLLSRDGLLAVDPIRGSILWSKSDISPRSHVFGDEEHVYVVDVAADGTAAATRAVRALDGVSVEVPRFAELYQKRLRILGRRLLVRDTDAENRLVLRLYDVHTGEDVWKKVCPANSVVLRTEEPDLTGVAEPDGSITIVDLRTRKEVARLQVPREHLDKVNDAHLLQDSERWFVVLNRPIDPQLAPFGAPMPNVMWGMRSISANGTVHSFGKASKSYWRAHLVNQMLVLDQFHDLPFALFTSRYNKPIGGGVNRGANPVAPVRAIDKQTGKLVFDQEFSGNTSQQFYSLNLNAKDRTAELVSYNMKIRFYPEGDRAAALGDGPGATGTAAATEAKVRQEAEEALRREIIRRRAIRIEAVPALPVVPEKE